MHLRPLFFKGGGFCDLLCVPHVRLRRSRSHALHLHASPASRLKRGEKILLT
jgi:hypothetical protein